MWQHDAPLHRIDPSLLPDSDVDGIGDLRGIVRKPGYVRSSSASTI